MNTGSPTVRVMSAEEIAARAGGGDVPFLRLAERGTVFAERAMRLRQLAFGHPMHDFLLFIANLANAQQARLAAMPAGTRPPVGALGAAARAGLPPLPATDLPRDAAWRDCARALATAVAADAPAGLAPTLTRVATADDGWLEQQADCLLTNVMQGLDLAASPIIAAALQVWFTDRVIATQAHHGHLRAGGFTLPFGRTADLTCCPCCGSRPTAGITRLEAAVQGQRYLACSLCSTQWHLVRIQCSHCLSTQGISYESLQPQDIADDDGRATKAAVQAEVCGRCGHYLKLVHMERDPNVDPLADDLARGPWALRVAEGGGRRRGTTLMRLLGDRGGKPPLDPGGPGNGGDPGAPDDRGVPDDPGGG